jgi:uracil-DNA glycosylase
LGIEQGHAIRDAIAYLKWIQEFDMPALFAEEETVQAAARPVKPAVAPAPAPAVPSTAVSAAGFEELKTTICECQKCRLGKTRTQAVFGVGNPNADLMFIGEAPGATEDKTGLPFVGPAGRVLTEELQKNGVTRDEVFIANIIKCRPPENRDPLPDEIEQCEPYLHEQIRQIGPKMLCALGRYAAQTLLKHEIKIMQIRGSWLEYQGLPLFICLHPSSVLHNPNNRPLFNADIVSLANAYRERHAPKVNA